MSLFSFAKIGRTLPTAQSHISMIKNRNKSFRYTILF